MTTKGNPSRKIVRRKQLSGGAKLKAYGKKPILLGVKPEVWEFLKKAALKELRPLTQFILYHACQAASRTLAQESNTLVQPDDGPS